MSGLAMITSDHAEVERIAHLLPEPDSVVEPRILDAGRAGTVSGYFKGAAAFVKACETWSGKAPGVYVTLNPCNSALLARSQNRVKERAKATTTDRDIVKRRWLPIDFDPVRPGGISSTEGEHHAALARAQACQSWLTTLGWPEPVYADSGNGAHLLYRIDLPNDDASRVLMQRVLQALALHFSDDEVALDEKVFNAARIWKVYGTLCCKGDHTPERPHRLARVLEAPSQPTIVPQERLEALAAMVPEQPQAPRNTHPGGRLAFSLDAWIAEHGLFVLREGAWGNGGHKWLINPCPWNGDHTDKAAYIVQFANGAIAAGCHHNGCTGKGWADLRDLYEPDWRQRREAWEARQTQAVNGTARVAQVAGVAAVPEQPRIPDPLRRELPASEPYPVDALGSLLATMTHRLMKVVQAPGSLCAQSVLAAATLAVQPHRDVTIDGRTYPLSAYYLTLGESGERKTEADKRALWPHREREYELTTKYDEDSLRFENERDAYKKSREDILRKEKNLTARKAALDLLGAPPVGPLKPLLTTGEPGYPRNAGHFTSSIT